MDGVCRGGVECGRLTAGVRQLEAGLGERSAVRTFWGYIAEVESVGLE